MSCNSIRVAEFMRAIVSGDSTSARERVMPVLEMNAEQGFATLRREEVVRRCVRRITAVLDLNDFGGRLDLSGVAGLPFLGEKRADGGLPSTRCLPKAD